MKVYIQRFKQLDDICVELGNLTLLIGGNNAGKSSILQAIQFGVSVSQATSLLVNSKWNNDTLPTSIGKDELIYLPIKDVSYLAPNGRLPEGKGNGICITYSDIASQEAKISISKGRNKNIAIHIDGKEVGEKLQSTENPFSMLVTGLAGIPNEERYQTPLVVKKAAARGDSNSVFRNILLLLKEKAGDWNDFLNEIQEIFPNYQIDVNFDKDKDEFIMCTITKDNSYISYPIDSCGTGILQVIQILSYIYLFKPKVLLLDEPDSHLHPNNQRLLAQRLLVLSENTGTKIVIATHSKYLINELIDDSELLWLSNGKIQDCENNKIIQSLVEIGALDSGQRLSPPRWVLLTEDSNLDFLKTLILANGAKLEEGEIKSYKGCTKIETAQALLEYLKDSFPNAKFIIHRDRDFFSDDKIIEYKDKFQDIDFLILIFNDIESYFISLDHLTLSCGVTNDLGDDIINSAWKNNKEKLIKKYVNVKIQQFPFNEQIHKSGELAAEASILQNQYDLSFIHGKEMLKFIRKELSDRKIVDRIMQQSNALRDANISKLFE